MDETSSGISMKKHFLTGVHWRRQPMRIIRVKSCYLCPYEGYDKGEHWCSATKENRIIDEKYHDYDIRRPDWCPLEEKNNE